MYPTCARNTSNWYTPRRAQVSIYRAVSVASLDWQGSACEDHWQFGASSQTLDRIQKERRRGGRGRKKGGCHSAGFTAVLPGTVPLFSRLTAYTSTYLPAFPLTASVTQTRGMDLARHTKILRKINKKGASHSRSSILPPSLPALLFISATLLPPTSPWRSLLLHDIPTTTAHLITPTRLKTSRVSLSLSVSPFLGAMNATHWFTLHHLAATSVYTCFEVARSATTLVLQRKQPRPPTSNMAGSDAWLKNNPAVPSYNVLLGNKIAPLRIWFHLLWVRVPSLALSEVLKHWKRPHWIYAL